MDFDPREVRPAIFYQHMIRTIVPRPIAWVSTMSGAGVSNVAPFSYFTGVGSRPPSLLFCPANNREGQSKDTLRNIEENGEFVVNVVSSDVAQPMNDSAAALPPDESEFAACGLTESPSHKVAPPGVAESPVQYECRLMQIHNIGEGPGGANIVLGEVVHMHLAERVLGQDGFADPRLLDAVGRMGGLTYCRTTDRFDLDRPE